MLKRLLIPFVLFVLFFAYRVYFWEDFYKYGLSDFINAIGDAIIAWYCGALIFRLNERNAFFHKYVFVFGALLILLATFVLYGFHYLVFYACALMSPDFKSWFNSVCFQLLDSLAVVITGALVHIVYRYANDRRKMQEDILQLTHAKDLAELNYLKSRVDPHFIFNGLNNIFYEIDPGNTVAKSTVLQFSDIMRYHLQYADEDKVEAAIEMQYIRSFINFQYGRSADFIDMEQEFQVDDEETSIEPLLLLPFIENAFKFCESETNRKGKISLKLKFDRNGLDLKVSNSYNPFTIHKLKGNGFGLKNVIKRLELIYKDRFDLNINDDRSEYMFYCHLKIVL